MTTVGQNGLVNIGCVNDAAVSGVKWFFRYDSQRILSVHSKKLGILLRSVQIAIWIYIIMYIL